MFSEEESPLKHFNKIPKSPKLPDVMTDSQPSQQSNKMDWMRQQMTQMQAMMKQMSRSRPINPAELEQKEQELEKQWQHEWEMTQLQLQIMKVKAKTSVLMNLSSIQIVYKENKIVNFWKEIFNWNSKLIFKLKEFNNYESWRDEALIQALEIKMKSILRNIEISFSDSLISDDDKLIWEIKSEILFDMLLSALKSMIR